MEQIKSADIDKVVKKNEYKFIGLYDATGGECIVAFNSPKIPVATKIKQIKTRIPKLDDGYYTLICQHALGKKNKSYRYIINKGNLSEPLPQQDNTNLFQSRNPEQVRGWSEALKDKEELARLKAENARLKLIEEEYNNLPEEEDEEETTEQTVLAEGRKTLAENLVEAGKEIIPQFLPIFDRYFDLRNREITLREKELEFKRNPAAVGNLSAGGQLKTVHPFRPAPDPSNGSAFSQYCQYLEKLDDQQFSNEMLYLKENNAVTFEAVKKAFNVTEPPAQTA